MKKQYSILSVMFVLALSFFLTSCGAKKDEALVTDFNAKKTDADKMLMMMTDDSKMMIADHAAWTAKLDSAGKAGADTAKIAGFKAEMKKHEDMDKAANANADSIKYYENAKVDNNDQLKAATAGLNAQLAACTTSCNNTMDMHKKLGTDITAFLAGSAPAEAPKEEAKKPEKKATSAKAAPAQTPGEMDASKHAVKPPTSGTQRRGSGAPVVK